MELRCGDSESYSTVHWYSLHRPYVWQSRRLKTQKAKREIVTHESNFTSQGDLQEGGIQEAHRPLKAYSTSLISKAKPIVQHIHA